MTEKSYNFGEKNKEKAKGDDGKWIEMDVWQTPKYLQSKEKAIEIIEKSNYGVTEADFWILMNRGGSKMCYTGLIISHNGCLKINAKLDKEKRFKPECATVYKDEGGNIIMLYICPEQGIFEFGEVSPRNCKNDYPYAMALKRLQDRVILKTSEIAFFGIYSDSEGDDFKEKPEDKQEESANPFFKKPDGAMASLAEESKKDLKLAAEEERLNKLAISLAAMGSIEEIEGYLQERGRLKVLMNMSEINAAQAKMIIKNAKLAIDPEYKGE